MKMSIPNVAAMRVVVTKLVSTGVQDRVCVLVNISQKIPTDLTGHGAEAEIPVPNVVQNTQMLGVIIGIQMIRRVSIWDNKWAPKIGRASCRERV